MGMTRIGAYICILQTMYILRQSGTLAANVYINQNITTFLGNKDSDITCSFFLEKNEHGSRTFSVEIFAKNITEDFDDFKSIAIFHPERPATLPTSVKYLSGRVTLTNITHASTNATIRFQVLKCVDEKDYICKYNIIDMDGSLDTKVSAQTRISVKVPVRDVQIKKQPKQRQYDRKTRNIILTCKASGNPEPQYTWFKENNNSTIIARTNLYVIEDVIQNNSGVYTCEAYNNINNVNYKHSNSVKIDIVDEILLSPEPASSKNSSGHAVYAVPVILGILVVVAIVIFLVRRKHGCNRSTNKNNKKSSCRNRISCFKEWHSSDETLSYTPVVDKKEPGDINDIKKNEIICKNNEKDIEKNFDIIQNLPTTSSNIYAVPCDSLPEETVTCKIVKDRGKNEDNGVSDQDPVYSEVFNEKKMKYEMSMERTSEPPDIVVHNGDGISADQCHV